MQLYPYRLQKHFELRVHMRSWGGKSCLFERLRAAHGPLQRQLLDLALSVAALWVLLRPARRAYSATRMAPPSTMLLHDEAR